MVDLPIAIHEKNGLVKAQAHEAELRRCAGLWDISNGSGSASSGQRAKPVSITLTNQRILLQSQEQGDPKSESNPPREVMLTSIVKVKVPQPGFFGSMTGSSSKKAALVIKITDQTKYLITFVQQPNTIYKPEEDRDECFRLLSEYLKVRNPVTD